MKNRVHDVPVKMIQILPVNNGSSKQPLKPSDFSFLKKLAQRCRREAEWVATTCRQSIEAIQQQFRRLDHPVESVERPAEPIVQHIGDATVQERPELPAPWMETSHHAPTPGLGVERAPDIVVRDIVVIQPNPSPPLLSEPTRSATRSVDNAPPVPAIDWQKQFDKAKAAIAAQWLHEREQIAAARAAALVKLRPAMARAGQSLRAARIELLRKWAALMYAPVPAPGQKREEKKAESRSAAQDVRREIEVTKATLLAQQQALENVTVQLHAVQKELVRHKNLLAGLMTQVEIIDLKLAGTSQPSASRKAKANPEGGQPKRASTKKSDLIVERSGEQRV